MPIYQFKNLKTGVIEEHFRTVEGRDIMPPHLQRVVIPQTVGFANSSHLRESGADEAVPKAFREMELAGMSARKIAKDTGFSVDHIRRTWAFAIAFLFVLCLPTRAGDLQKGYSFTPNDTVTSVKLNNVMDLGTISADFLHLKSAAQPVAADEVLMWQSASATFKKFRYDVGFLGNTNLIVSQSEDTAPKTNDYILTYSTAGVLFKKVQLQTLANSGALTAQLLTISNNPAPTYTLQILSNGVPYSISLSNLFDRYALWATFTNLSLSTAPGPSDLIELRDVTANANKTTTLKGIITNALPVTFAGVTGLGDRLWGFQTNTGLTVYYTPLDILNLINLNSNLMTAFATTNLLPQKATVLNVTLGTGVLSNTSHGLGATPQHVKWVFKCVTAENGYAIGDEIPLKDVYDSSDGAPDYFGGANSTNVFLIGRSAFGTQKTRSKADGTLVTFGSGNWTGKCYADRFP